MATVTFDKATRLYPGSTKPAVDAIDLHVGARHAFELLYRHCQHLRPAAAKQPGCITEFEPHANAIALNIDRTQASGRNRILIQMRVGVLTQYGFHSFACD